VWPPFLDTDDLSKKKLHGVLHVDSADQLCYVDFSVSTTGMLTGAKVDVLHWKTFHYLQGAAKKVNL